jgi:hypothetical protein
MSAPGTVTVNVEEVLAESDKALLVLVDGLECWIPKSLIDDDSECYSVRSGPGPLIIPLWFADREGLS